MNYSIYNFSVVVNILKGHTNYSVCAALSSSNVDQVVLVYTDATGELFTLEVIFSYIP